MGADSLCYIMDYSGNYYRINEADQLVTAGSKEGASVLTFSQANGRIGAGKKAGVLLYDSGRRGKCIFLRSRRN